MKHHPSTELIIGSATGSLTNALGMLVACHIDQCENCKAKFKAFEAAGGQVIETEHQEQLSSGLLDSILDRLDEARPEPEPVAPVEKLPKPLWGLLPDGLDGIKWSGMLGKVKTYDLPLEDDLVARFYKIKAGSVLPKHTHRGEEYTLVLAGEFSDGLGTYREGDFILADDSTHHQPVAGMDQDCICFAVLSDSIKFTGPLTRLLNPLM